VAGSIDPNLLAIKQGHPSSGKWRVQCGGETGRQIRRHEKVTDNTWAPGKALLLADQRGMREAPPPSRCN